MATNAQGLDVGKMALEGFGQVMDSMDLLKRAWSNFSLATPFTPTLSVEELDKRIVELRAVEQWLTLNQNMLRNTVRGLEVQRGTLEAISTMSQSFGQMTRPADDAMAQTLATFAAAAAQKAAAHPPTPAPGAAGDAPTDGGFDWSPFGMPSASVFNRPQAAAPDAAAAGAGPQAPGDAEPAKAATPDKSAAPDSEAAQPPAAMNPLAWWEMLQANFRQIAQAATLDAGAFGAAGAGGATDAPGMAGAGRNPGKGSRGSGAPAGSQASHAAPSAGGAAKAAGKAASKPVRKPAGQAGRARTGEGAAAGRTAGAATGETGGSSGAATRVKRRTTGGAGGTG